MEKIKIVLLCFLVCLSFSACNGEKIKHWKQEVLLQDGRVILMERTSVQSGRYFPENISIEMSQAISFINPDTKERVAWDIPGGLNPFMLDFEDSVPYFVLETYGVASYN